MTTTESIKSQLLSFHLHAYSLSAVHVHTLYNTAVIDIAVYESKGDSPTITGTSGFAYFNHINLVNVVFIFIFSKILFTDFFFFTFFKILLHQKMQTLIFF